MTFCLAIQSIFFLILDHRFFFSPVDCIVKRGGTVGNSVIFCKVLVIRTLTEPELWSPVNMPRKSYAE